MPEPDDLLSTADVCEMFGGLHPSTVTRWVQLGRLTPAMRVSARGVLLFRRADVEAYRDARAAAVADDHDPDEPNGDTKVAV